MFTGVAGLAGAAHALALAAEDSDGSIITRDNVSPGGIGFVLFLLLGIGTFLLWRSMNKQLKRIDFDDDPGSDGAPVDVTDSSTHDLSPKRGANETPEH